MLCLQYTVGEYYFCTLTDAAQMMGSNSGQQHDSWCRIAGRAHWDMQSGMIMACKDVGGVSEVVKKVAVSQISV